MEPAVGPHVEPDQDDGRKPHLGQPVNGLETGIATIPDDVRGAEQHPMDPVLYREGMEVQEFRGGLVAPSDLQPLEARGSPNLAPPGGVTPVKGICRRDQAPGFVNR